MPPPSHSHAKASGSTSLPGLSPPSGQKKKLSFHSPIKVHERGKRESLASTKLEVVSPKQVRHASSASMQMSPGPGVLGLAHPSGHMRRSSAPTIEHDTSIAMMREEAARKVEEIRQNLEKSFESATKQQRVAKAMKKQKLMERLQLRRLRARANSSSRPNTSSLTSPLAPLDSQTTSLENSLRPSSSPMTGAGLAGISTAVNVESDRPSTTHGTEPSGSSSWVLYRDEFSNPYYYNVDTGMSQWERPAGFKDSADSNANAADDTSINGAEATHEYAESHNYASYEAYADQDQYHRYEDGIGEQEAFTGYEEYGGYHSYEGYHDSDGYTGYDNHYGDQSPNSYDEVAPHQSEPAQPDIQLLKKKMELKLKQEERQMKKKVIALNRKLKTQTTQQDAILSEMQQELESEIEVGLMQQQQLQALQRKLAEAEREKAEHARVAREAELKLRAKDEEKERLLRQLSQPAAESNHVALNPYSPEAVKQRYGPGACPTASPIAANRSSRSQSVDESKHSMARSAGTQPPLSQEYDHSDARPSSHNDPFQEAAGIVLKRSKLRQRKRRSRTRESKRETKRGSEKRPANIFKQIAEFFSPNPIAHESDSGSDSDSGSGNGSDNDSSSTGSVSTSSEGGGSTRTPSNRAVVQTTVAEKAVRRSSTDPHRATSPVYQTRKAFRGSGASMETTSTDMASMNSLVLEWQTGDRKREQARRTRAAARHPAGQGDGVDQRPSTSMGLRDAARLLLDEHLAADGANEAASATASRRTKKTRPLISPGPSPKGSSNNIFSNKKPSPSASVATKKANPGTQSGCPHCGAGAGALRWKHCDCAQRLQAEQQER